MEDNKPINNEEEVKPPNSEHQLNNHSTDETIVTAAEINSEVEQPQIEQSEIPAPGSGLRALLRAQAKDLAPALKALEPLLARLEAGETLTPADLPNLADFLTYDATAAALEEQLAEAILQGATTK